ncbi:hypothetical protein LSTR_LSTR005811 [Laodelphax striatellus]|uniref:Uncharacterized protein n=1 Tax=Laodelphax striatellus TaxID=195883 RepID=A0A482WQX1_LAOST|nr:hypothetical protein LSTR_LSTR005811 [Laodelphax striatellus]
MKPSILPLTATVPCHREPAQQQQRGLLSSLFTCLACAAMHQCLHAIRFDASTMQKPSTCLKLPPFQHPRSTSEIFQWKG